MEKQIQKILNDLYQLDPKLRNKEWDLTKIICELIELKPQAEIDPNFENWLKQELIKKISYLSNNNKFNFMKKFFYPAFSLAVVVLAIFVFSLFNQNRHLAINLNPEVKIIPTKDMAFNLSTSQTVPEANQNSEAVGLGGGGGLAILDRGEMITKSEVYQPVNYRFIYQGEDFSIEDEQLPVLKRIKNQDAVSKLGNILSKVDLGILNFSKLINPRIQTLNIIEDRDFGYSIYLDLMNEMVSMNQNWERWQTEQTMLCQQNPDQCQETKSLTENDLPSDEVLIEIASAFLQKYQINMSSYGKPFIDNQWKTYYKRLPEGGESYLPDIISIIYPLTIDGQEVYDQEGTGYGLNISVNIRENKVIGLWGLATRNYQSSLYATEKKENILAAAEKGGFQPYFSDASGETVEIGLDTPQKGLVVITNYINGMNEEIIAPCLLFPIKEIPQGHDYWRKGIIVPLIKDLMPKYDFNYPEPMQVILDVE